MPPDLRCVVVDDEPLPRLGLRRGLESAPGVTVVGEAGDGLAALEAIATLRPDLVFLDVQMPGLDGFEVLANLDPAARPAIVFVTAFDQYAVRAFEAHAIDYLLKPFDDERLHTAVERARRWLSVADHGTRLQNLHVAVGAERGRHRFVVRHAGRLRLIGADEIRWIEARGNYVHLHTADGAFLLRDTMNALAATLPDRRFVRVHRSAIVAVSAVSEIERLPSGDFELRLHDGSRVPMSRTHKADFVARWQR